MDPQLKQRLNVNKYQKMMSLSISLPKDDEIEKVCTEVQFQLIKRSGFVNSMTYADTFGRRKTLWFCWQGLALKYHIREIFMMYLFMGNIQYTDMQYQYLWG